MLREGEKTRLQKELLPINLPQKHQPTRGMLITAPPNKGHYKNQRGIKEETLQGEKTTKTTKIRVPKMNKYAKPFIALALGILVSVLNSCNSNRLYEKYHGLENYSWPVSDTLNFQINEKTDQSVLSTLRIKYNDSYDYYNIYIRYLLKDSLNNTLDNELLDITLFDPKTGKPLGSGYGNSFTEIDTLPLNSLTPKGAITIQLIQYMRSSDLKGIESVGIKLEKE